MWIQYRVSDGPWGSGFSGSGGPPVVADPLFRLFNNFFCHGPQDFYDSKLNEIETSVSDWENRIWPGDRCKPYIKTLVFNVTFEYVKGPAQDERAEQTLMVRLPSPLQSLDHSPSYFCNRVGKVVMLADGKELWRARRVSAADKLIPNASGFTLQVASAGEKLWKQSATWRLYGFE